MIINNKYQDRQYKKNFNKNNNNQDVIADDDNYGFGN